MLIALWETETAFDYEVVQGRPSEQAASRDHWPTGCGRRISETPRAGPSARRAIREAQPYFADFPFAQALEPRFTSGDLT